MRFSSAVLLAITSFFATVSAVPAASTDALGTVTKVWPNGMVEYTIPADEYFGSLHKRQTIDLSGATCESTCSGPPGPGPNQMTATLSPTRCYPKEPSSSRSIPTLSSSLHSPAAGSISSIKPLTWSSTRKMILASVASFLAGECNAAHGFSVGQCTFDEQPNAFIQVLHS
ncbi:hypothetical protein CPB84DRAFT_1857011 [Gymnopilus junonius]|uniref:Uncharacterized protein n=1 Tax=Gymnopilus junonius TaxID=109634 RepID=A0A9P5N8Z4_GYMJU|nr:hypothetical protein CPB84DRAFT_1857011 [Gymnopilus junonius]